jgi:hypothetical protein
VLSPPGKSSSKEQCARQSPALQQKKEIFEAARCGELRAAQGIHGFLTVERTEPRCRRSRQRGKSGISCFVECLVRCGRACVAPVVGVKHVPFSLRLGIDFLSVRCKRRRTLCEWLLEQPRTSVVALSFKQSAPLDDKMDQNSGSSVIKGIIPKTSR